MQGSFDISEHVPWENITHLQLDPYDVSCN